MSEVNKEDSSGKPTPLHVRVREALNNNFSIEEAHELTGASIGYVKQIIWADKNPEKYAAYCENHRLSCKKRRIKLKRRAQVAEMRKRKAELRESKNAEVIVPATPVNATGEVRGLSGRVYTPMLPPTPPTLIPVEAFLDKAFSYAPETVDTVEQYEEHFHVPKRDMVNNPPHYTKGGIETIAYIKAKLTPEQYIGYLRGNVLKYSSRLGEKGNIAEDAGKLAWYSRELEKALKEQA